MQTIIMPASLRFTFSMASSSANAWWRAKMFLFWFVLFVKRRLSMEGRPEWFFWCRFGGKRFGVYLADETDVQTFASIFGEEEYAFSLEEQPKVILDLGSNIGLSLIYFALRYPNAKIFGFEPNPYAFGRLNENIQAFGNVSSYNIAVSDRDGTIKLHVNKIKSTATSIRARGGRETIEDVPVATLGTILKKHGLEEVDLLKFDVEGAEDEIFSSPKNLEHIENIVGEVHTRLMTVTKESFLARFAAYNLTLFEKGPERFILKAKRI